MVLSKKQLILRDYQVAPFEFAMKNDIAVLALAPNGGKTEISIYALQAYINLHPKAKGLVLAHSTNVLKDNYIDRLNETIVNFTYSDDLNAKVQVHVCLPQSRHNIKGHYDFLIVDEAHENYLGDKKNMTKILKEIKPKKQLLLTGTPSKFIRTGDYDDKIFVMAINSIPKEYFAKLNIELVASKYNWAKELNAEYEIKTDYVFTKKQTQSTLDEVVLKLIERVRTRIEPESFNLNSMKFKDKLLNVAESWGIWFRKLGKTLFVCRSIKQASDVYNILKEHGVNVAVSHSKNDPSSAEIVRFKNGEYNVLIVVDRARLGFSDENLYNLIDMSGTHNPNEINQMFSRILRGDPKMEKYYLKVTTNEYGMKDFTHACVCGALMLTDNKYLSTFNGKNFGGMLIPVIRTAKRPTSNRGSGGKGNQKPEKKFIFPEFTSDVIDMFRDIIHDPATSLSIYKMTTIAEVRAALSGKEVWTFEKMVERAAGIL